MKAVQTLSEFCEEAGLPHACVADLLETLQRRELVSLARHEARMSRFSHHPRDIARPLTDENGEDWGQVEARIPATLFFNLLNRPGFGWEGLTSDEGLKDILRDNPQCRVRTESGIIQSGWTPGRKTLKKYENNLNHHPAVAGG